MYIAYSSYIAYISYFACYVYSAYSAYICIKCILHMLQIDVYCANIAPLSCRRSKRNAAAAEAEGAAAAARRRRAGRRPGVAIPGRIRMTLQAMKSVHKPVVVGLAGMVQEQPATRPAGMDPSEICINMQRICSYMNKICIKYANI